LWTPPASGHTSLTHADRHQERSNNVTMQLSKYCVPEPLCEHKSTDLCNERVDHRWARQVFVFSARGTVADSQDAELNRLDRGIVIDPDVNIARALVRAGARARFCLGPRNGLIGLRKLISLFKSGELCVSIAAPELLLCGGDNNKKLVPHKCRKPSSKNWSYKHHRGITYHLALCRVGGHLYSAIHYLFCILVCHVSIDRCQWCVPCGHCHPFCQTIAAAASQVHQTLP